MDFDAGLPILGASIAALLLFTWLQMERRAIRHNLRVYDARGELQQVAGRFERIYKQVRWLTLSSTPAAPLIMFFSGQLDAYGIAHEFDNRLQMIAPITSAYFAAADAWLLIASPLVVHGTYRELLSLFRCQRPREFW
jgi:hypothetical protein